MIEFTIEMQDANGIWTESLGVGREKFSTIEDAREAIESLHNLSDESFHRDGRIVDFVRGPASTVYEIIPFVGEGDQTVCGKAIRHDASGHCHNWKVVLREEIPANIVEEIEGEIIDGGNDSCDDFVASNGQHYRW